MGHASNQKINYVGLVGVFKIECELMSKVESQAFGYLILVWQELLISSVLSLG